MGEVSEVSAQSISWNVLSLSKSYGTFYSLKTLKGFAAWLVFPGNKLSQLYTQVKLRHDASISVVIVVHGKRPLWDGRNWAE
jgi:hypothetical protein